MSGIGVPGDPNSISGPSKLPAASGPTTTTTDVAGLLEEIFRLPPDKALSMIDGGEIPVETVIGVNMPFDDQGRRILVDQMANPEPIDISNIQNIYMELEGLVDFSHQLSLHTSMSQNSAVQYQKYIDSLKRIAPLFSSDYHARIYSFFLLPSASHETTLASLRGVGLLPEQVFMQIYESRVIEGKGSIGLATMLTYKGILSYKKLFEKYLSTGVYVPQSEKPEITNEELLIFIRSKFMKSLEFLQRYLSFPEVWRYIQAEYGDHVMRSIFQSLEDLESGYSKRIGLLAREQLTNLDYSIFYEGYIVLVQRLLELRVTPSQISLRELEIFTSSENGE